MTGGTSVAQAALRLVIGGHVDHGKSTILGRLLADTGSLPEGKLEQVRAACERTSRPFEYAFLLDALKDEQAQGITIDAARVFFRTERRPYLLIDAPGHVEFVRNLVTGAARAEAALLVIDAKEGVQENSRRHGYLMGMLGIRQFVVLVNKMDLVGWSAEIFAGIVREYGEFLSRAGVSPSGFIPVSGREGDNVARRSSTMAWYRGVTVLEALDAFHAEAQEADQPFRMPVQDVYKFTQGGDSRRIVAGTVEAGRIRSGDEVVFFPSGKQSRVATIEGWNRPSRTTSVAGEATGFTLAEQIYVARGELAALAGEPRPDVSTRFKASVFWLGRAPLVREKEYLLKLGTARVPMRLEAIHRVLDSSSLRADEAKLRVDRHEVADVTLRLNRAIAFDPADRLAATSRFAIIDDYEIRGGGIVREALVDAFSPVQPAGQRSESSVIWFTGLSGSGKSTIAEKVAAELRARDLEVEYLDGDSVRMLFPQTGFTRPDRDAHIQRIGFLASRLEAHGVFVVASFVSPYRDARDRVRSLCKSFVEVYVSTPLEECERRDVKGLYAKARRGEIQNFTGISDPYEAPERPEIVIDTTQTTVEESVRQVVDDVLQRASTGRSP